MTKEQNVDSERMKHSLLNGISHCVKKLVNLIFLFSNIPLKIDKIQHRRMNATAASEKQNVLSQMT